MNKKIVCKILIVLFYLSISIFCEDSDEGDKNVGRNFQGMQIGGGIPISLISKNNSSMSSFADAWGGTFEKKCFGGTFNISADYIPNIKNNQMAFGGNFGYCYHGTSAAKVSNIQGIQTQEISISSKIKLSEFRIVPGIYSINSKDLLYSFGCGVHYTIVKYSITGFDNEEHNSLLKDSESSFGVIGTAKVTMLNGIGFECSVTGHTFYIGAVWYVSVS